MRKISNINKRPCVLTIAGFDPSGGAGILADIKTFEQLYCYGLAVQTANTVQTDQQMTACYWTPLSIIKKQLELLLCRFEIAVAKIGIIENTVALECSIALLKEANPKVQIILDPILSSSTHFDFHDETYKKHPFCKVFKDIDLLTPNVLELNALYKGKEQDYIIKKIVANTNLLLKGGHLEEKKGIDTLFTKKEEIIPIFPQNDKCTEKHGSGCVLSAAIVAYLSRGDCLEEACKNAKRYVEDYLSSTTGLLGIHEK